MSKRLHEFEIIEGPEKMDLAILLFSANLYKNKEFDFIINNHDRSRVTCTILGVSRGSTDEEWVITALINNGSGNGGIIAGQIISATYNTTSKNGNFSVEI